MAIHSCSIKISFIEPYFTSAQKITKFKKKGCLEGTNSLTNMANEIFKKSIFFKFS